MILFLCFLLWFSFDWEDISNTDKTVFDHISKHLKVCQKYRVFSTSFSMFGNVVKHGLLCFIYYIKTFKTEGISFSGDICYKLQPVLINYTAFSTHDLVMQTETVHD